MRSRFLSVAFILFALPFAASAEVIGRCGKGYLERIDGCLILHVKGTPYEMGFQHGTLLKDHCLSLMNYLFDVKAKQIKIDMFGYQLTPKHAISTIFAMQRAFIPQRYIEEMQGIADAVGVDERDVFTANGIPELFHCSGFALLKEMTSTGTLLHGRILDYSIDWRLQEHAIILIAEPDGQIPFVNVTYAGFIGSVTGMNKEQISIGEMGGRGAGKWAGTPMTWLMRRVLEEANSLDEAIAIFRDSKRTCEYYYVLADAKKNDAVGMEGSADRFFTIRPGEAHERLPTPVPNTVLLSAGDRYKNLCKLVQAVRDNHQKYDVERAIRLMDAPVAMKDDLHNVLMAPGLGQLWVANASYDNKPAWTQKYHHIDFWKLLAQPLPADGQEFSPPPSSTPPQPRVFTPAPFTADNGPKSEPTRK